MAASKTQRKLTAILCADMVGYSRLMGDDEEATLETLTAYRKVFTSSIPQFRGRVVDAKGDAPDHHCGGSALLKGARRSFLIASRPPWFANRTSRVHHRTSRSAWP